jgi:hypothetical protein
MTVEKQRLTEARERTAHWRRWGPYLSERQWGTVREDYSPQGTAWDYFPHDHARSRAYRWGEDGLLGISDNHQRVCLALALWNERDPILKERLFGLTGPQGNHGEDVKECYFYLDSTPTHSYMKALYKYPQAAYPYARLTDENGRRSRREPELELMDTGVFDEDRYFDVTVEYAKATPDDILARITVVNRGPAPAPLRLLPTIWFRNTWSWDAGAPRPRVERGPATRDGVSLRLEHPELAASYRLDCEGTPELLFTENETNVRRLFGGDGGPRHAKDAFHDAVVHERAEAVDPTGQGTKAAAHYRLRLAPGEQAVIRLRLRDGQGNGAPFGATFDRIVAQRQREADEFYAAVIPAKLSEDGQRVMRQALAGMLWSKQWYHYDVRRWLEGDPAQPAPPPERWHGRNRDWAQHLYSADVISMPDKWEYPWYAAWDLAFHAITLALVDADFAKDQLMLFLREWYMHPNGQIPAYEWALGDVNPPVHAWAAWRVYKIDQRIRGAGDREFLERIFHKLLLNFTWWVNRKDPEGRNVFQGGFLGLDNIGVFDRSAPLPTGGHIEQSDGTAWMGMFCLNMLTIALELARENRAYEDVASKFFEHFVHIAHATNDMAGEGIELWDERDGFFYDVLHLPHGAYPLRIRSMVGLVPLFAVASLEPVVLETLPRFARRMRWFLDNRPHLAEHVVSQRTPEGGTRWLFALVGGERLRRVLRYVLDEAEFLSPYGVRALSRYHRDHPYVLAVDGREHRVDYEPAESSTGLFGGNSNWRGPIWFPVNYLLIEAIQRFDHFYGPDFRVECPTGSGRPVTLWDVATELSRRLTRLFLRGPDGRRPVHGGATRYQTDPHWQDLVLFYEYFHGDDGAGVGASHQTGWTGLVAKLLQQAGE